MRFIAPEDLPYGPGQSDYEYDDERQRELDDAGEQHAADLLQQQRRDREGENDGDSHKEART